MSQQVGDYFGVGFRGEAVAQFLEFFAQLVMVLDDAVVDYGQPLGHMGVRVVFGGFAVGGPAGVGYTQMAVYGRSFQRICQLDNLADCAGAFDAVAGGQDGDAGGVIAAVFEAAQAFYEDGGDVAFGDGAYYSAHWLILMLMRFVVSLGSGCSPSLIQSCCSGSAFDVSP